MDESRLKDALRKLAENADHSDGSTSVTMKKSRRRIMRNVLAGALVTVVLISGVLSAGNQLVDDDGLPPVDRSNEDDVYGLREAARDGDITFLVGVASCSGEGTCFFDLQVTNEGDIQTGPLDPRWQILRFEDGTTLLPDEDEMRAYGEDFFTNRTAFNLPLPPEELMFAALIYSGVPNDALPLEIELHGSKDSDGVVIRFRECDFTNSCETPGPHPSIGDRTINDAGPVSFECGRGRPFDASALEGAGDLENEDSPLGDALRDLLATPDGAMDGSGWRIVWGGDGRVLVMAPTSTGDPPFVSAVFEETSDGWDAVGWGDCTPTPVVDDRSPVRWRLTRQPDGDTKVLEVSLEEIACSSGRELNRENTRVAIDYDPDSITILVTGDPLQGGQTCPLVPSPFTIELDEPLEDRALFDAATYPPEERTP